MKKSLNEQIVATIRNSLPVDQNIVSFLSDLFFWNKEAIYRRLRCEIPFNYCDIVLIANKLNFSIDNIVRLNLQERVLYDLCLPRSIDPVDLYCEKRGQLNTLSRNISESKRSDAMFALNHLPYSFAIYFESLSKFEYYKWLHQTYRINPDVAMSDVELPQKIMDMREVWINQNRTNERVTYILDSNVFLSVVKDIDYFHNRNLINTAERKQLKEELLSLIEILTNLAHSGFAVDGTEVQLYISPIDIKTNYAYLEYDNITCCYVQVYGIDILQSYYPQACESQKQWIELHKRYSILISRCNEKERFEYFNQQRAHILTLDND